MLALFSILIILSYYHLSLCHKEPNQHKAKKDPSRGLWVDELVLYGIKDLKIFQDCEALDQ